MSWRCWRVRKQLALMVGDDLPDREKRSVEKHLNRCSACRDHIAALRRAHDVMLRGSSHEWPGSAALWPSLRKRLELEAARKPVQGSWLPVGALTAASVAMAVMLWNRPSGSDSLPSRSGFLSRDLEPMERLARPAATMRNLPDRTERARTWDQAIQELQKRLEVDDESRDPTLEIRRKSK